MRQADPAGPYNRHGPGVAFSDSDHQHLVLHDPDSVTESRAAQSICG
jgi:hypothetical protein